MVARWQGCIKCLPDCADRSIVAERVQTVRIQCPNLVCQRILAVTEECRGRLVRCKGCQTLVRVPERGSASELAARARAGERAREA